VFAAALEKGRSPNYAVSDGPVSISTGDGTTWNPRNYDGSFGGYITLREALRKSRNMVAIRLGQEVGIPAVRDLAARTGLDTPIPGYPSVYIGAAAVYPLDMMAAYATFANGGYRVEPRYVVRIEDSDGNLLWQPSALPEPAVDPAVAWIVTDMLREVVDRGTGLRRAQPGHRQPALHHPGGRQDRHDQRRNRRLVRGLHTGPPGRRVAGDGPAAHHHPRGHGRWPGRAGMGPSRA
jgi:membrane peptidoglycan carboxypeptidase